MKKRTRAALLSILFGDVQAEVRNAQIASFIPTERYIQKLIVGVEPVQDLHGYDNPWPAGGGANQWDEEWEVGTYSNTTGEKTSSTTQIRSKNYIPVLPTTSYRMVVPSGTYFRVFCYDTDKAFLSTFVDQGNVSMQTPSNCYYITFQLGSDYGTTYQNNVAINKPASVTTYSPYSNECPITGWSAADIFREASYDPTASPYVTVSFGQTVYGGRLDVIRGVLKADMVFEVKRWGDGLGSTDLGACIRRFFSLSSPCVDNAEVEGDICNVAPRDGRYNLDSVHFYINGTGQRAYVFLPEDTDADTNVELCYHLVTPVEISLTPTQIATIQRQVNYVWADCGPIIELIS